MAADRSRTGRQAALGERDPSGRAIPALVRLAALAFVAWGALGPLAYTADAATGKLAFTSEEASETVAIYVMGTDGTGRARLGAGSAPAWSPDRSRIAFVHDAAGNADIWSMRADGSDRRRLTDDPASDLDPAWSPDGASIAFTSDRIRSADIFVMDAGGRDETSLTNNPEAESEPTWSPDGQKIAYASATSDGSTVYTMAADGSQQNALTSTLADYAPAWAPDGSKIAFVSSRSSSGDIYSVPPSGGREARLTSLDNADDPSWSSDSQQLAFSVQTSTRAASTVIAQSAASSTLYTMNADGSSPRAIASAATDWDPTWEPAAPPGTEDNPGAGPVATAAPGDEPSASSGQNAGDEPSKLKESESAADQRAADRREAAAEEESDGTSVDAQSVASFSDDERERSRFPASLIQPTGVDLDPSALVGSALLAVLIPLLLFPAILFNNTLEENYDEVRGWFRRKSAEHVEPPPATGARANLLRFVPLAFAAALAAVFLDPELDLDRASLALFLGLIGAFVVATVVDFAPLVYLRRRRSEPGSLRTYGGAFVVVVVCVALSRAIGFEPGYLYGTVAGFAMASTISGVARGWAQTISVAALLVWAIAAWLLWVPIGQAAEGSEPGFVVLVADSLLAAAFVGGVESAVFALVPVRFLEGRDIFDHHRAIWLMLTGIGAFAFVHILLVPSLGYSGSTAVMLALFGTFGAASVAFWAYFRFRSQRSAELEAARSGETVSAE